MFSSLFSTEKKPLLNSTTEISTRGDQSRSVAEREEADDLVRELERREEDHKLELRQREKELQRNFDNEMAIQASELMQLREALGASEDETSELRKACSALRSDLERTHCDAMTTTLEKKRSSNVHKITLGTSKSKASAMKAELLQLSARLQLAETRATSAEKQLSEHISDVKTSTNGLDELKRKLKRAEEARVGTDAARVAALKRAALAERNLAMVQRELREAQQAQQRWQDSQQLKDEATSSTLAEISELRQALAGAQHDVEHLQAQQVSPSQSWSIGQYVDPARDGVSAEAIQMATEQAESALQRAVILERQLRDVSIQEESARQAAATAAEEREALRERAVAAVREARALRLTIAELKGAIRVVVRVRPPPSRSGAAKVGNDSVAVHEVSQAQGIEGGRLLVDGSSGGTQDGARQSQRSFDVDTVLGPSSSQQDSFEEVEDAVSAVVQGVDCALVCYGQTGSGKTHTMLGPDSYSEALSASLSAETFGGTQDLDHADAGIIPRSIQRVFDAAEEIKTCEQTEVTLWLSMLEIYNEQVRDLSPLDLSNESTGGSSSQVPRQVFARLVGEERAALSSHTSHGSLVLEGLQEVRVHDPIDVIRAVLRGLESRASSKTDMNDRSSRSHLVVRIRSRMQRGDLGDFREGVLTLVDLAGSERLARSGALGEARLEAQHINKSLSALGNVLSALQRKSTHIPFRDSALTSLLSPCLTPGGGGRAILFAHISPVAADAQESTCTLEFAVRAARVQLGRVAQRTVQAKTSSGGTSQRRQTDPASTQVKQDLLRARTQLAREKARCEDKEKEIDRLRTELAKQRREATAKARESGGNVRLSSHSDTSTRSRSTRCISRPASKSRGQGTGPAREPEVAEWRPLAMGSTGEVIADSNESEAHAFAPQPMARLPPKTPMRVSQPKGRSRSKVRAKAQPALPPATPMHLHPARTAKVARTRSQRGLQSKDTSNRMARSRVASSKSSAGWKSRVKNVRSKLDCGQSRPETPAVANDVRDGVLPPSPDIDCGASDVSDVADSPACRQTSLLGFFDGDSGAVVGGL